MPDLTPTEWHTVAIHSLINDVKHTLEWLAIGQLTMAFFNAFHAVRDIGRHDWYGLGFDVLLAAAFVAFALGTTKRGRKYGKATRAATNPTPANPQRDEESA